METARFCRLADGSRVAFGVCGGGPPLVMPPGWLCHLHENWSHPAAAAARARLAAEHRFVWYDRLGCGLSDREGFEPSLDNDLDQLVAVLDAAGIERASFIGYSAGALPVAAFAARNPERVERLVFLTAFARGRAVHTPEMIDMGHTIVNTVGWPFAARVIATMLVPNASSEDLRWYARFQQVATSGEMAMQLIEYQYKTDVLDLLPHITAQTLVLHDRQSEVVPLAAGEEIAALVPDATMHVLEGNEHDPFIRDSGGLIDLILDFLAGRPLDRVRRTPAPASCLTPREQEVLCLIAAGEANKQIATRLDITVATVERHISNVYRKLGARGRADAVMAAVSMGLASPT